MARTNNYKVTAYDMEGAAILAESTNTKLDAGRIARDFLGYSNVYTVEVVRPNAKLVTDYKVGNYVKTSTRTACYIPNSGEIRNVRITF